MFVEMPENVNMLDHLAMETFESCDRGMIVDARMTPHVIT